MSEERKEYVGLKKLNKHGKRQSTWNHAHDKATKRLAVRVNDYEKTGKGPSEGFKKPGSMKCY